MTRTYVHVYMDISDYPLSIINNSRSIKRFHQIAAMSCNLYHATSDTRPWFCLLFKTKPQFIPCYDKQEA